MRYAIVIEKSATGYGAYVPDLPGCIAVAAGFDETVRLIREGIEFQIEGLKADGFAVPEPTTQVQYVEVEAAT